MFAAELAQIFLIFFLQLLSQLYPSFYIRQCRLPAACRHATSLEVVRFLGLVVSDNQFRIHFSYYTSKLLQFTAFFTSLCFYIFCTFAK
jgi:hypothetical protein